MKARSRTKANDRKADGAGKLAGKDQVSDQQLDSASGGVSLDFKNVEYKYQTQKPDGSLP